MAARRSIMVLTSFNSVSNVRSSTTPVSVMSCSSFGHPYVQHFCFECLNISLSGCYADHVNEPIDLGARNQIQDLDDFLRACG